MIKKPILRKLINSECYIHGNLRKNEIRKVIINSRKYYRCAYCMNECDRYYREILCNSYIITLSQRYYGVPRNKVTEKMKKNTRARLKEKRRRLDRIKEAI